VRDILNLILYALVSVLPNEQPPNVSLTPPLQHVFSFPVLSTYYAPLARRGHTVALPTFSWDIVGSRQGWWPAIIQQQARGWETTKSGLA